MQKPQLLYVCLNDGSDTRINKEVKSLSRQFDVHYVGIGRSQEKSFVSDFCKQFILIQGHHKEPLTLFRWWIRVTRLLLFSRYHSIHLINEQLILLFFPFLILRRNVVLDIFDSIFLRKNGKMAWLQKVVYQLPQQIIVTDDNRKSLMPDYVQHKIQVVENYPYRYQGQLGKQAKSNELTIFYNGSMSRSRGTDLLKSLLQRHQNVKVKMAGWVYDEPTRELTLHPQVEFLGVLPQQESMRVAAGCDYILSLYEPINENNINASPNKIYDAIQVCTPVIINREVKIASFVQQNAIGYVMDSFYQNDYEQIAADLHACKQKFVFSETFRNRFTWEAIEGKLLAAHI